MRYGVPTTEHPADPNSLYVRCMFHTFWWGPFKDEAEVGAALKRFDAADPYWDYDCFCVHYGVADMKDAVNDPVYVSHEVRERIEELRKPGHKEEEARQRAKLLAYCKEKGIPVVKYDPI